MAAAAEVKFVCVTKTLNLTVNVISIHDRKHTDGYFFVIRCAHAFTNDHFTFELQQQHFLNCESGKKSKTEKKTHTQTIGHMHYKVCYK